MKKCNSLFLKKSIATVLDASYNRPSMSANKTPTRPPLTADIRLRISQKDLTKLKRLAVREEVTVSHLIRQTLKRELLTPPTR